MQYDLEYHLSWSIGGVGSENGASLASFAMPCFGCGSAEGRGGTVSVSGVARGNPLFASRGEQAQDRTEAAALCGAEQ